MKNIIGLDIGTASIGWAYVREAESSAEKSYIIKLGVRIISLSTDEQSDFAKGQAVTTNQNRTAHRSARRNLQRFKHRRESLIQLFKDNGWVNDNTIFAEDGKNRFETLELRAKAVNNKISLEQLARVLLSINKKRGYKSNRKVNNDEEGQLIDGMEVALLLKKKKMTPGQYSLELSEKKGKNSRHFPDYYRSDLVKELDLVWDFQKQFHPDILTEELYGLIRGKGLKATGSLFWDKHQFNTAENRGSRDQKKIQALTWRVEALSQEKSKEIVAYVIADINNDINKSSGYLSQISDRSKELYFNKITVGEYLYRQVIDTPDGGLKNQVFYRKDYENEFDIIWDQQAKHHHQLTINLKKEIKLRMIFFQRPLKSQKQLVSICELEGRKIEIEKEGRKTEQLVGPKVCPKSSLLFQEFRIWQKLNDVRVLGNRLETPLTKEEKELVFKELTLKSKLSKKKILSLLEKKHQDLNFDSLDGNRTIATLFVAYQKIVEASGHGDFDFATMPSQKILSTVESVFKTIGIDISILSFEEQRVGNETELQPINQLWHLLYSYQDDSSNTGNESLIKKLKTKFGFDSEYAKILASVTFEDKFGNLSTKAIRKVLPHLKDGHSYDKAATIAGYNHSHSLTKEELEKRPLKKKLEMLPKNYLHNPVVEKILNQMIHVVNGITEEYGKPDEIRIELARELKHSSKEREEMTLGIKNANKLNQKTSDILSNEFHFSHVRRKDIIKYKLYEELKGTGYKTLYSGTYIARDKLFTNEFDVEHIIPQSRLFDDSFSNKTLARRNINLEKGDRTAIDYVFDKWGEKGVEDYKARVEELYKLGKKNGGIGKGKYKKLLMHGADIPDGFVERDLRNSQYIAKKTKEILEDFCRTVNTTTGRITEKLRNYWQLVDVMQELNYDKFDRLGLTHSVTSPDGNEHKKIIDWNKRNDHRHHAMDALVVAFTKHSHVQYFNYMNARKDEMNKRFSLIAGIEKKELEKDKRGKLRVKSPIALSEFRASTKKHLESLLISFKTKNKVVTINSNKIKGKDKPQITNTPRGPLHKETIYGSRQRIVIENEKVGPKMNEQMIQRVREAKYRKPLLERLRQFDNDPKKAFTGNNWLEKKPIFIDQEKTEIVPQNVEILCQVTDYTIRKPIDKSLKIEKVVEDRIKTILMERLEEFDNDPKKAFVNLDENPIWINKEKRISLKRVKIYASINPVAIHYKKDRDGKIIRDQRNKPISLDYVLTSNNHHVAIFEDQEGNWHEDIRTFFEVVKRKNSNLPVIEKTFNSDKGWKFLFSLKMNECFVFPNTEFEPSKIDLKDEHNFHLISPNLFRLQKLSRGYYTFRHHLESQLIDSNELNGTTFKRITTLKNLVGIVKVRINHIGKIVNVGEY